MESNRHNGNTSLLLLRSELGLVSIIVGRGPLIALPGTNESLIALGASALSDFIIVEGFGCGLAGILLRIKN